RRHGRPGEHRLTGHAIIAVGMVVSNEALVTPIPEDALPRETAAELIRGEKAVKRLRSGTTRERDAESVIRGQRRPRHPFRHMTRQRQRVSKYLDFSDRMAHRAHEPLESRMKRSIALAKPSSLYVAVTAAASAFTSSEALPMAMLKPERLNISTSFG